MSSACLCQWWLCVRSSHVCSYCHLVFFFISFIINFKHTILDSVISFMILSRSHCIIYCLLRLKNMEYDCTCFSLVNLCSSLPNILLNPYIFWSIFLSRLIAYLYPFCVVVNVNTLSCPPRAQMIASNRHPSHFHGSKLSFHVPLIVDFHQYSFGYKVVVENEE